MENYTHITDIATERWEQLPIEIAHVVQNPMLDEELSKIASYYKLGFEQTHTLKNEVLFVLYLFEPITRLETNITRECSVSSEIASRICSEIELIPLFYVKDILYDIANDPEFVGIRDTNTNNALGPVPKVDGDVREKLELRPEGMSSSEGGDGGAPKPLTREEVLNALTPKRTMQGDIRTIQSQEGK